MKRLATAVLGVGLLCALGIYGVANVWAEEPAAPAEAGLSEDGESSKGTGEELERFLPVGATGIEIKTDGLVETESFRASGAPMMLVRLENIDQPAMDSQVITIPPLYDPVYGEAKHYTMRMNGQRNAYLMEVGFAGGETQNYLLRTTARGGTYHNLDRAGLTRPGLLNDGSVIDYNDLGPVYRVEGGSLAKVDLDFDYGRTLSLPNLPENLAGMNFTENTVVGLCSDPLTGLYIVVYGPSPYRESDGSTYDNAHCALGIAVFDRRGAKLRDFGLPGLYFQQMVTVGTDGYTSQLVGLGESFFSSDEPGVFYLGIARDDAHIASAASSLEPYTRARVNLNSGVYEVVSEEEFQEKLLPLNFPIDMVYRDSGTHLYAYRYNSETAEFDYERVAFLEGDYIPACYSGWGETTREILFVSESASDDPAYLARHPANAAAFQPPSIERAVWVEGERITFAPREVGGAFSMTLPAQFSQMSERDAAIKYRDSSTIDLVLTDKSSSMNFTFSRLDGDPDDPETETVTLEEAMEQVEAIKGELPGDMEVLSRNYYQLESLRVGCLDYRLQVVDGDMYVITFVVELEDGAWLCNFSCIYRHRELWEPLVRQMIQTIDELD